MKENIKKSVKSILIFIVNLTGRTRIGHYIETVLIEAAMERAVRIIYKSVPLIFSAPNALSKWRYETFASKEPETLEWIDEMPPGSVLWDIGANVGLYSVYAAKKQDNRVWAFEPSIFNLELLARNIYLNDLTNNICIVPFALSNKLGSSHMKMTSTEWGGALSTFGETYGWDGKELKSVFEFKTIGVSMEDAVTKLSIPQPDYIKLDVDGTEHLILKGGPKVLKNIKGILIEVNDAFYQQASECQRILSEAGLVLKEKRQSKMVASSTSGFANAFNQIWFRPAVSNSRA